MAIWSGTSFAAPMASSALALALGGPAGEVPVDLVGVLRSSGTDIDLVNLQHAGKLGRRLHIGRFLTNLNR
jgi:hypothetical protein